MFVWVVCGGGASAHFWKNCFTAEFFSLYPLHSDALFCGEKHSVYCEARLIFIAGGEIEPKAAGEEIPQSVCVIESSSSRELLI